jgi:hypothetical protein
LSRFFVEDGEYFRRDIIFRDGDTEWVELAEMSEEQIRHRSNMIIDPSTGRRGGGSGIRLDRQRVYDFKVSIKDWSFEDENGKLPIEEKTFKRFKGYITEQIADHIRDLNALPEDIAATADSEAQEDPT